MSIAFLALGTSRARAVCGYAQFLVERGIQVDLVTVDEQPWRAEGLDQRVRVLTLSTRADKLLSNKVLGKFYKLVRPYAMWRAARRQALRKVDWSQVEQAVISDSHAIPIGWHLARKYPGLPVAFELDRTPYLDRAPTGPASAPHDAAGPDPAGTDAAQAMTAADSRK
ncbi:MAG: hypothetical protein ACRDVE_16015 [Actinocrinis sp.]